MSKTALLACPESIGSGLFYWGEMVTIKSIESLTKHEFYEFLDSQFNAFPLRDDDIDSWMSTGYGPADDNSDEAAEVNRWGIEVLVDPDGAYRVRSLYRVVTDEEGAGYLYTQGETYISAYAAYLGVIMLKTRLIGGQGPVPSTEDINEAVNRHEQGFS